MAAPMKFKIGQHLLLNRNNISGEFNKSVYKKYLNKVWVVREVTLDDSFHNYISPTLRIICAHNNEIMGFYVNSIFSTWFIDLSNNK